ncbi:hypothetical protein MRY87_04780 [bacterium]|nr:hypothetical protein [bacterium]
MLEVVPAESSPDYIKEVVRKTHHGAELSSDAGNKRWFEEQHFVRAFDELELALHLLDSGEEAVAGTGLKRIGIFSSGDHQWQEVSERIVSAVDPERQAILTNCAQVGQQAIGQQRDLIAVDSGVDPSANGIDWYAAARGESSARSMGFRTGHLQFVARFLSTTAQQGGVFFPTGLSSFVALTELQTLRQLHLVRRDDPVVLIDDAKGTFAAFQSFLSEFALRGGFISAGDEAIGSIISASSSALSKKVRDIVAA